MWKNINCVDPAKEIKSGQILGHIENEAVVRYKVSSVKKDGYATLLNIDGGIISVKLLPLSELFGKDWLIESMQ